MTIEIDTDDTLANGAEVLASKTWNDDRGGGEDARLVLASWRGEWVVWWVAEDGEAFWGHYFDRSNLVGAVEDFEKRRRDHDA